MKVERIYEMATRAGLDQEENACDLCELHYLASQVLEGITCPKCDHILYEMEFQLEVVGDNNRTDREHITQCPVATCTNCEVVVALLPTEIHYNCNHDVYYTGEPCYLNSAEDDCLRQLVKDGITGSIDQFVQRVRNGEKLEAWNLKLWIERDIEHIIAQFLYQNGYKRSMQGHLPGERVDQDVEDHR